MRFRASVTADGAVDVHIVWVCVALALFGPEGAAFVVVFAFLECGCVWRGGGAGGVVGGAFLCGCGY